VVAPAVPREEIVVPFPPTLREEPAATHCRGTLIAASVQTLKRHGHYDRYVRAVPPEHLNTITSAVAGMWLPMDVGMAHYGACETLDLPVEELLLLGSDVVHNLQRTFIGTVLKAAGSGAGISPLVGLQKFTAVYSRTIKGGGARVIRVGPKDVRVEFVGLPLAVYRYFRVAYRGFIQAGCEFFTHRVVAKELTAYHSQTTLAYRIAWV